MNKKELALYHMVKQHENFTRAIFDIFRLLKSSQFKHPNCARTLYVDIEGHKNQLGDYNKDAVEFQNNFTTGCLLKFFTKIHLPLFSVENHQTQCNDIPDNLGVLMSQNNKLSIVDSLFIENYTNTEFIYEKDVLAYLVQLRSFLCEFRDCNLYADECTSTATRIWKNYIVDLTIELHNDFSIGNFISVSAMTRVLIESYAYLSILSMPDNQDLVHYWYICGLCHNEIFSVKHTKKIVKDYCRIYNLDFSQMWKACGINNKDRPNEKKWLKQVLPNNSISFNNICEFLKDKRMYNDYEIACEYIHAQDIISKVQNFTFYPTICNRFSLMMEYIIKTIGLFPLTDSLKAQLSWLEHNMGIILKNYNE